MKITAVIPIRSGSQRVKDKNLRAFADTNLMELKIKNLLQVPELTSIVVNTCLLYTSPSPRDLSTSRMPSSA